MLGRRKNIIEDPVNSKSDEQLPFKRFDMNITGSFLYGLKQKGVHQANDRGFIRRLQQIDGFLKCTGQKVKPFSGQILCNLLCTVGGPVIKLMNAVEKSLSRGYDDLNRGMEQEAEVIQRSKVKRIWGHDLDLPILRLQGKKFVLFCKTDGNFLNQFRVNIRGMNLVQERNVQLNGQGL